MSRVFESRPGRGSLAIPLLAAALCALGCTSQSQISLLGSSAEQGNGGSGAVIGLDASRDAATSSAGGSGGSLITTEPKPDAGHICRTGSDCSGTTPYCDAVSGACVSCLVDSNCQSYLCDTKSHVCATCVTKADCHPATPYCDDDDGRCVQCTSAAQCPLGQVCVAEAHACAARCVTPGDCAGSDRAICATAAGVCVECANDADCTGTGHHEFCDLRVGSCVECLVDADCGQGRCTPQERRCVGCLTSADCSDGARCVSFQCTSS